MTQEATNIFKKEHLWSDLIYATCELSKKRSPCIAEAKPFSSIGKRLTGSATTHNIDLSTQRREVNSMNITLDDVPRWAIYAKRITCIVIYFYKLKAGKSCFLKPQSKAARTSKKLNICKFTIR